MPAPVRPEPKRRSPDHPGRASSKGCRAPTENEPSLLIELGRRHSIVDAQSRLRVNQIELRHCLERPDQGIGHHADLRRQPAEDAANFLRLARSQERELGRLLTDRGRLDVDGLVAGAGAEDRAGNLTTMVLGHGQNIMMSDHREIGKSKNPPDRRRTKHLPERLLDSLLGACDLPPQRGQAATGGIDDLAPVVEAALDGDGNARKLADTLAEPPQPRELLTDIRQP